MPVVRSTLNDCNAEAAEAWVDPMECCQATEKDWLSFSCLVLAGAFLQAAASVFWTIPTLLFTASVAGAARGAINALGNLGGFLGPFLMGWLKDVFGGTDYGVLALVAFLVISVVITTTLPNTEQK